MSNENDENAFDDLMDRSFGPVSGEDVFNRTRDFIKRFVVLTDDQAVAITLWVMMTHATDNFECVPYLSVSGLKGAGKTRLCEVLRLLVARPEMTQGIPPVTLAEKLDQSRCTLIFDEVDTVFIGRSQTTEGHRRILNAGYRRGGKITTRKNDAPVDLNVFGPKLLAWKSDSAKLPDTIAHRSIPIAMLRKLPEQKVERFRELMVRADAKLIKGDLERWALQIVDTHLPEPDGLDVLSDRAADICEPLLQIAEECGDGIAIVARDALHDLCNPQEHEEPDSGFQMLQTIYELFENSFGQVNLFEQSATVRKLRSDDIAKTLGINQWDLRNRLKPYGIKPKPMRFGHVAGVGGYLYADFVNAWRTYGINSNNSNDSNA